MAFDPSSTDPPSEGSPRDVTELLLRWQEGDAEAAESVTRLIYGELHRLAHSYMRRESHDRLLQTTALVNEAYVRLADLDVRWEGRSHFFGICAQLMRRILVDAARRRRAKKRGGDLPPLRLGDYEIAAERADHLVALDDVLQALEKIDRRKSKALELRYFGGMTAEEIGDALQLSTRSVERDLRLARAWVADALKAGG